MGETVKRELPPEWKGIIPSEQFLDEAKRIVEVASEKGIVIRIIGGIAIRLHCMEFEEFAKKLVRLGKKEQEFSDLDFMSYGKYRKKLKDFFKENFNYIKRKTTLSSAISKRDIYFHPKLWWFTDVFFDELMVANHPINFRKRLELESPTITVTDLLLEKLQMWEALDLKDIKDVLLLLRAHDIGESEKETVNGNYIAKLFVKDWGFYYTATTNLKRIIDLLEHAEEWASKQDPLKFLLNLSKSDRKDIISKGSKLLHIVENEPKGFRWKMRAKVGTKKQWYNPVETEKTISDFGIWRLKEVFPDEVD
ncbi:MAG: hypothetical protein ACFFA1_06515 [Promethearchaeota archaeon]